MLGKVFYGCMETLVDILKSDLHFHLKTQLSINFLFFSNDLFTCLTLIFKYDFDTVTIPLFQTHIQTHENHYLSKLKLIRIITHSNLNLT